MKLAGKLSLLLSTVAFAACQSEEQGRQVTHVPSGVTNDASVVYYVDLDAVRLRTEKDGGDYLIDYRNKTFTSIFHDRDGSQPSVQATVPFNQVADPDRRAAIDTLLTFCEKERFPEGSKKKYLQAKAVEDKAAAASSAPALLDSLKKRLNAL